MKNFLRLSPFVFCLFTLFLNSPLFATDRDFYNPDIAIQVDCDVSPDQSSGFMQLGSSCYAPSWLSTSNITQTTATFNWSYVNGAMSYSLQWRYANGTWYDLGGGPWTGTWVNVGNLQPGTAYEWRVRSNCSYGEYSPWSYPAAFTTLGSSCETPTWPSTSNITNTTATFSWSPVYGATSYSVQTRIPNGTWYDVPGSPFNSTSITVTGLSPNTTYQWRVKANCGYNLSSYWTSPITFTTTGSSSCNPPYSLYTTNITQTSAKLNWSAVYEATSYSIQWRYPGGYWSDLGGGPWQTTWLTLGNLTPGTTYEWRVRSNCGYGVHSPWSYPDSFTTLGQTCSTPEWPSTYNITHSSASFSWSPVYGATSYTVQIRQYNGNWYDVPGSPVYGTYIYVTGLYANTTYQWRVRANCGYGNYSNYTYPITFTTTGDPHCFPPYYLYTSHITQTSAKLHWSSASGAHSYSIQWRYPGGTWYNLSGGPWYNTWVTIGNLTPATTYEWRVRSNCGYGEYSPWSYANYFTTLGQSCHTPSWPATYNITSTSATFSWSPVYGAHSYTVQTRLPNGTWYDVPGGPFTGTHVTVNGLYPNTTYQWRVRANCGYGLYSYWTYPISFTTGGGASCLTPHYLFASGITQSSATLNWSSVSGAISYSVQYRLPGGIWYDHPGGDVTGTSVVLSGLQQATKYEWRVRSNCDDNNHSLWSHVSSFTTLQGSCDIPEGLDTADITETTVIVSWSPVSGALNYNVQLRAPGGSWSHVPGGPFATTTVMISNLNPGTLYEWRVRANCGHSHSSDWSEPFPFTTAGMASAEDNDQCINATLLTVNSTCINTPATNVGATPSTPAPTGWCPTNWYKDVWFKFSMPDVSNPTVTIRTTAGTLSDAVMEVYSGECNNLTLITCEDDNYNGNGSAMPVINLTGTPNQAIWVRVWGYAGTTGTFNICVLDYHSNSYTIPGNINITLDEGVQLEVPGKTVIGSKDSERIPSLHLAPNPAKDVLYVTMPEDEDLMVTGIMMMDMSGKIVIRKEYVSNGSGAFREDLDVSLLAPGMYIMQVLTTGGIITERVSVVE